MDIRAAEISKVIKDQIANFGTEAEVSETGQVLSVGDGIARARKPEATSVAAHHDWRRTARRPTGHGGRGNPVAVADDDAATRTACIL
jgi:hypothetical protein